MPIGSIASQIGGIAVIIAALISAMVNLYQTRVNSVLQKSLRKQSEQQGKREERQDVFDNLSKDYDRLLKDKERWEILFRQCQTWRDQHDFRYRATGQECEAMLESLENKIAQEQMEKHGVFPYPIGEDSE